MLFYWIAALLVLIKWRSTAETEQSSFVVGAKTGVFSIKDNLGPEKIDTAFYSRQLLVYGKSAQLRLFDGDVAIIGENGLTYELVKNLALTGVGKITVFAVNGQTTTTEEGTILANEGSLRDYVRAINDNVQVEVHQIDSLSDVVLLQTLQKESLGIVISANQDFSSILLLNKITRNERKKLIAVRVIGNTGMIFNDLLEEYTIEDIDGESYKEIPLSGLVRRENNTENFSISCIDEENLNLGLGDLVEVKTTDNDSISVLATVKKVETLKSCIIELLDSKNASQLISLVASNKSVLKKRKSTISLEYQPFHDQLIHPKYNPTNSCLSKKQEFAFTNTLFAAMKALDLLLVSSKDNSRNTMISREAFDRLIVKELQLLGISDPYLPIKSGGKVGQDCLDRVSERIYASYTLQAGKLSAVCPTSISVIGAIASQEVIKTLTSMYQPIHQIMLFESLSSLPDVVPQARGKIKLSKGKKSIRNNIHPVALIYGPKIFKELQGLKVFIVGSGAIGCELLKNFALVGIGGSSHENVKEEKSNTVDEADSTRSLWDKYHLQNGGIIVTDMDLIEKSNLNRQLLFRAEHIGQPKSLIAAEQIKAINPTIHIHPLTMKVDSQSENIFNESFWKSADAIITALDNIDARKYVDSQCVKYKCWLIDSGTLGTKANTQVVIPYLTESYSSSSDPPEEAIPLCTLKSFPYQPDHCIAWSKQLFQQLFQYNQELYQKYFHTFHPFLSSEGDGRVSSDQLKQLYSSTFAEEDQYYIQLAKRYFLFLLMDNNTGEDLEGTQRKKKTFLQKRNKGKKSKTAKKSKRIEVLSNLILYAMSLFQKFYDEDIRKLIQDHPMDSLDEDDQPFWGGSRRFPQIISLDLSSPQHQQFIISTVILLQQLLSPVLFDRSGPLSTSSPYREEEIHHYLVEKKETLIKKLKKRQSRNVFKSKLDYQKVLDLFKQLRTIPSIEFDKDNVALGHVDFVMNAANLRAKNYQLREVERLEAQKISGNIIPALATTTSFIAGQVTSEIIKLASVKALWKGHIDIAHKTQNPRLAEESKSHSSKSSHNKKKKRHHQMDLDDELDKKTEIPNDEETKKAFYLSNKEMLLKKFRNTFINLADNGLSFIQPVEATTELIPQTNISYTIWDDFKLPDYHTIENMTIRNLLDYLQATYRIPQSLISSIAFEDHYLYHRDLLQEESEEPSSAGKIEEAKEELEEREDEEDIREDEDSTELSQPHLKKTIRTTIFEQLESGVYDESKKSPNDPFEDKDYITLDVTVISALNEMDETKLPPIIIKVPKFCSSITSPPGKRKSRKWFPRLRSWFKS